MSSKKGKGKNKNNETSGHKNDEGAGKGAQANSGETALWTALKHDDDDALREMLFSAVPGDDNDREEESGGMQAFLHSPEGMRLVPKPTAKHMVNKEHPQQHKLPLTYAIGQNLGTDVVEMLLYAGASVSQCESNSKHKFNALLQTCWVEEEDTFRVLLQHSKDHHKDLKVGDTQGRTPLHVLASSTTSGAVVLMECLVRAVDNGETLGELLCLQDKSGCTPLHLAFKHLGSAADFLLEKLEELNQNEGLGPLVERLLETRTTTAGETPLLYLISSHSGGKENEMRMIQIMQRLLALKANFGALNLKQQGAFSLLVSQPNVFTKSDSYKFVLDATSDDGDSFHTIMRTLDEENGFSPLHYLIISKNTIAFEILLKCLQQRNLMNGADWLKMDTKDNIRPVELAATCGDTFPSSLLQLLLEHQIISNAEEYQEMLQEHLALQKERQAEEEAQRALEEEELGSDEEDDENDRRNNPQHVYKAKQNTGPTRAQQSKRVVQKAARERAKLARELEAEEGRAIEYGGGEEAEEEDERETEALVSSKGREPQHRGKKKNIAAIAPPAPSGRETHHPRRGREEKHADEKTATPTSAYFFVGVLILAIVVSVVFSFAGPEE